MYNASKVTLGFVYERCRTISKICLYSANFFLLPVLVAILRRMCRRGKQTCKMAMKAQSHLAGGDSRLSLCCAACKSRDAALFCRKCIANIMRAAHFISGAHKSMHTGRDAFKTRVQEEQPAHFATRTLICIRYVYLFALSTSSVWKIAT